MGTTTPPLWWKATVTAPFVMQRKCCGKCRPSQVPGVMDVELTRLGALTAKHQVMAIRVSLPDAMPQPFEIRVDPSGHIDWAQFIEDAL